jgi:hypothetical protein
VQLKQLKQHKVLIFNPEKKKKPGHEFHPPIYFEIRETSAFSGEGETSCCEVVKIFIVKLLKYEQESHKLFRTLFYFTFI